MAAWLHGCMAAWLHGRFIISALVVCLSAEGADAQVTIFFPQGVQVSLERAASSSGNSSNCQIACAATALSNLFGQGTPGGETDPTDPITLLNALQQSVGNDPENSDSVAAASSSEGDSLSGDPTGSGFGVTTYGDVQDPDGGPAGGPTPPTTGIGSNESMILLVDFPSYGHAYLLQGSSMATHLHRFRSPPPWIDDPEPFYTGEGDIFYYASVYTLSVYEPVLGNFLDIYLSPDGTTVADDGIGNAGSVFGDLGGGIRLTRNTP